MFYKNIHPHISESREKVPTQTEFTKNAIIFKIYNADAFGYQTPE